jgi:hypothetical protein
MISVTPFCYEYNLGMHLVPAMIHGIGEQNAEALLNADR